MEVKLGDDEFCSADKGEGVSNGARDEAITHYREEIFLLRTGLKEKQSIITKYERQQGIGLKVHHSALSG